MKRIIINLLSCFKYNQIKSLVFPRHISYFLFTLFKRIKKNASKTK